MNSVIQRFTRRPAKWAQSNPHLCEWSDEWTETLLWQRAIIGGRGVNFLMRHRWQLLATCLTTERRSEILNFWRISLETVSLLPYGAARYIRKWSVVLTRDVKIEGGGVAAHVDL